MNDITPDELKNVLEEACDEAMERESFGLHYVSKALKDRASQSDDDPLHTLVAGLDYHLRDIEARDKRGPYGPMMEMGGRQYPMRLSDMSEDALEVWAMAVGVSPLALVAARFADLLWERRHGHEPYKWCTTAIDAYLRALDEGVGHRVEIMDMGRRAFELARKTSDEERLQVVASQLINVIERSLDEGDSPGIALPLIELLVESLGLVADDRLRALVDRTIGVYGGDPWHLESALDLKARLVPEERDDLQRAQVEAFVDLANRSTGLVRFAHLQRAIEMATQRNLRDRADELRRVVEGITEEELEMKEIAVEVRVPNEEINTFVKAIVGDDDVASGLSRFGGYLPLNERDDQLEVVDELMAEHPIRTLFSNMTLGPINTLIRVADSPEDHREAELADHDTRAISFFGYMAVEMIRGLNERYGSIAEMAGWFESQFIEPVVAEQIAVAVRLYEAGEFDASASMLVPRLERAIRSLAQTLGLSVTGPISPGGEISGVKTLGDVLYPLEQVLTPRTWRYLIRLLVDRASVNLRNRISHGLLDSVSQPECALLIHAACHLSLFSIEQRRQEEG